MKFQLARRVKKGLALLLCSSMLISMDVATVLADEVAAPTNVDFDLDVEGDSEEATPDIEEVISEPEDNAVVDEDSDIVEEDGLSEESEEDVDSTFEDVDEDNGNIGIKSVSDDTISISEDNIPGYIEGLTVLNGMGKVDKNLNVTITWKKPNTKIYLPSFKGKFSYKVSKMNADGTFGSETTTDKMKYTDVAGSEGALIYKVVPVGIDTNYGTTYTGEASIIVAAPLIVSINRLNDPDDHNIRMDVSFVDCGANSDVVQYTLYRGTKNNKNSFTKVDKADLSEIGYVSDYVTKKGRSSKVYEIRDNDSQSLYHGSQLFYKVGIVVSVNGLDEKVEAISPAFKAKIVERAPKTATAYEMTGTRALLAWEDMTGNGGTDAANALLENTDYYQLYYSVNGGKLTKYKKLSVADLPTINTKDGDVILHASDGEEDESIPNDITIAQTGRYSTYYICENLKANATYKFYVAPVRNKIEGNKKDSNDVTTDILGMTGIKISQTTDDSLTVKWDKVEGAAGYKLYFKQYDNLADANSASDNWLDKTDEVLQHEIAPDKSITTKGIVTVKPGKADTVSYEIKKLESRSFYTIKVVPIRPDNKKLGNLFDKDHLIKEGRANSSSGVGIVRLATPTLTVKEDAKSGKVIFSWKKVNGAAGYFIRYYYYNAGVKTFEDARVASKWDTISGSKKLEVTSDKLDGFGLGDGMNFQLFAYDSSFDWENNQFGSKTSYNCSDWSELKTGYYRPENPSDAIAVYNVNEAGAQIIANNKTTSSTQAGVRVYRSYNGKTYDLVSPFATSYFDNDPLVAGKTVYYKVYAAAYSKRSGRGSVYKPEYEDYVVLSKKPAILKYCQPTDAKHSDVKIAVGKSDKVTISFKPSGTTMKQIDSWKICDDIDGANPRFVQAGATTKANNATIEVTGYNYSDFDPKAKDKGVAGLSPKIKITGLKKGSAYITAMTKNGCEATFRVTVTEAEDDDKKKDDPGSGSSKVVIVLDPGHGGSDSGTVYGGLKESEINLKISQYTKAYLEDHYGYKVYLTRSSDTYVGLEDRVTYAKNKGAKAIVSQHINSGGASGVECWHSIYDSSSSKGTKLAQAMTSRTSATMSNTNRGAKTKKGDNGDYYAIIRHAYNKGLTGVIMENGFIDNSHDRAYLSSDSELKKIAKANAQAIHDVYE